MRLSADESKELIAALGPARAQQLRPVLVGHLAAYKAHHGDLSMRDVRDEAVVLLKAVDAAAKALDAADRLKFYYWSDILADELRTAAKDLRHLCQHVPKHRDTDPFRMLVLIDWTTDLADAGIGLSEYDDSPYARALRVALLAMDRIVNRRYRGRRPMHDVMQPTINAVKQACQRRDASLKELTRTIWPPWGDRSHIVEGRFEVPAKYRRK